MNKNCADHSLTLGLGFPSSPKTNNPNPNPKMTMFSGGRNEPSLTLSLSGEAMMCERKLVVDEAPCSVVSAAASSLSNVGVSVKRERETASSDELEIERGGISSRISDEDEDGSCPITATRKKLRLTKDQSAMLEESFKQQSTLNPKQKQALADRLGLRPRQVEVWFQNRRARTKLKQTEVDCEYLKKCCETLTDENRRLQKELQELKALKLAQPFYMHLPAATLTMCPSCERIGAGVPNLAGAPAVAASTATVVNKNPFSMGSKTHHFYAASPNRPLLVDN